MKENTIKKSVDTCRFSRYDVGQLISNFGCKNCHIASIEERIDSKGSISFRGLAAVDSLKLIDYIFTKKHKGWYNKDGNFKTARMDTLSECEIKNIIHYIKDSGRDIPMPTQ
ncbi:c-type cytochrome [Pedobacter sp. CFBP9032]|uniref:c-type cytochrome n=1 Tax=Pedobacter sp. CFBP9032 TaxID=3096539 RepID=UPI002A6A4ECF|nr:c-type cytochrome [Pedobacter sp. CFBP9032]MDY0903592.1 c-type cytochrome [Pedobacter sp. CFBP9032]